VRIRYSGPISVFYNSPFGITVGPLEAHSTLDMQTEAARVMDEIVMPIAVNMSKRKSVAA
jgi:hypothetical protein